jgi:N-acetylmuramic acid 6-phosphate (MurNAc-6-P) etherase
VKPFKKNPAQKINSRGRFCRLLISGLLIPIILVGIKPWLLAQEQASTSSTLLKLLGLQVSEESLDYVQNKTQFQLHTLLTEQRHPRTMNLSERVRVDTQAGLHMLFSVDEDVAARLDQLAASPQLLEQLASEIKKTILEGKKIYVYGCGATGRLAKQMESTFWRPFWRTLLQDKNLGPKITQALGPDLTERLIGEMTGGDRALISSLEGFEDLQLIGRLQLYDRGVEKGDLVICVTEGGETSSVIGTILTALEQWKADPGYAPEKSRKKLYFIYNNPDDRLRPFERSRTVIDEAGITKINLTTGPMAITGSTRMQATTIETYVVGVALQKAVYELLKEVLTPKELARVGFTRPYEVVENLRNFRPLLNKIKEIVPDLAPWTELEASTYASNHFSTYFADRALITVFIDSTERSPTFRLFPLDTVEVPGRRCWIQVWTPARDKFEAWRRFLGRPFRGLRESFYRPEFEQKIDDPYLKQAALESLKKAGDNQQELYDFSFSEENVKKRGPQPDDLGVAICLSPEENDLLASGSPFNRFVKLFLDRKAYVVTVCVTDLPEKKIPELQTKIRKNLASEAQAGRLKMVWLKIDSEQDPFRLKQNIGLKMVLNAHSTAVMARLGRVVGNTMTNVSPSNLKLIGRATYLIQSHVNETLKKPEWIKKYGLRSPITYGEANAVLFDSMAFLKDRQETAGQTAEVALSIIRILEALRQKKGVSNEEALALVQSVGLADYLRKVLN